jgi:signal transduction histidine kinase
LKKIFYILLTSVFSLTGYFSIVRLIEKPDLPFEYFSNSSGVFAEDPGKLVDHITAIDGISVNSDFQLEFVIDRYKTGQTISFTFTDNSGKEINSKIVLVPYYENLNFIAVSSLIGFVFMLIGLFVALKKTENTQALLLYWILTLYGLATLTSPGYYGLTNDWPGYAIRSLHAISYTIGSLLFIFFIILFSVKDLKEKKLFIIFNSVLASGIAIFPLVGQHISAINNLNGELFEKSWLCVLCFLVYALITGAYFFIKDYRATKNREERKKREWILWGLTAGVSPYLIFWVLPRITGIKTFINEEYLLLFLILIPVSFTASVIKYHILDIELVVKRTFVYSVLSICIIGIYVGLIYLSSILFDYILGSETRFINLLAVLITALSFNPLRNRLNSFADRVFYREKYVFDKALKEVMSRIKECITQGSLGSILIFEIERLIPVSAIAVVIKENGGDRLKVLEQKNFDELTKNISALRVKQVTSDFSLPLAQENKMEKGINVDKSMDPVLKRWGINIAFPLVMVSNEITGAIVLGDKLSGLKYSITDIDLLNTIASSTAIALKRLELQEKLALEELELAKLEELNKIKSFYVASVSHDLKTPLTSIKVFTELMQTAKRIPVEKRNEYLKIIEGETDRLSRLIENVLDFTKIEKGIKQYSFTAIDLNIILKCVIKAIEYTLKINKFKVLIKIDPGIMMIKGDADAIKSALFNIISNSIKYSQIDKCIEISSGKINSGAYIGINDRGIGIPEEEQKKIYDPFFRSASNEMSRVKGAGLGLAIVKHVMDAHNGSIELKSKPNKGTRIRLIFPINEHD